MIEFFQWWTALSAEKTWMAWWLAACLVTLACAAGNRFLRFIEVLVHGWPPACRCDEEWE